jgi:hypothetical protein
MKYFLLLFILLTLSCNQSKNKEEKIEQKEIIKKEKTEVKEKIEVKEIKKDSFVKTKETLVIVLKNVNNLKDAKALIVNSGLTWVKLIINDTNLKAALIEVSVDKKHFWIDRLKTSNVFSSVEVNSEENIEKIKNIAKNTFVKIRKTHCSGDCPVFDMIVFNDGKVLFNGIENIPFKGIKEFILTKKQLKKLKDYFSKTSFNNYSESFIDIAIADFPSTFITYQNKEIEIKLWKNIPEELIFAYEYLDVILLQEKLIK